MELPLPHSGAHPLAPGPLGGGIAGVTLGPASSLPVTPGCLSHLWLPRPHLVPGIPFLAPPREGKPCTYESS